MESKTVSELRRHCKEIGIKGYSKLKKNELINLILEYKPKKENKNQVLTICKIPDSIDLDELKKLVNGYLEPRMEVYKEIGSDLLYESKFSEYHVSKASKGTRIGLGNLKMDVVTKDNEGIDVTCLIMKDSESNEKSLFQNFKSSGSNLDTLFNENEDSQAVYLFKNDYLKKLQEVKEKYSLTELYILAFISSIDEIHAVCLKINLENIDSVVSGGFLNKNNKNIIVSNFISSEYGNVKLYKSKKRMELRLNKTIKNNEYCIKIY
jgi:hypothetical protein